MATTLLHPAAGCILNVVQGAEPGPLPSVERDLLRRLADRVVEIARHPKQAEKRELWYQHNSLEHTRPMVLVFPEDSWAEIINEDQLELTDPFWRQQEWYLKHLIYRDENLVDDFVVEPHLYVTRVMRGNGWGAQTTHTHSTQEKGSWVYEPPLKELDDIHRLTYPTIEVDEAATQRAFDAVSEVFADSLSVRVHCGPVHANLIGTATALRGIE